MVHGPNLAHGLLSYKTDELRMVFTFVKGCEGAGDKKQINKKIACGPQSLKYLLSGPLQKKV